MHEWQRMFEYINQIFKQNKRKYFILRQSILDQHFFLFSAEETHHTHKFHFLRQPQEKFHFNILHAEQIFAMRYRIPRNRLDVKER